MRSYTVPQIAELYLWKVFLIPGEAGKAGHKPEYTVKSPFD